MPRLKPGAFAPDVTLRSQTGTEVRLSQFWTRQPILLVFLRHRGCPCAREHLVDLRSDYAQFQAAGAQVVVVTMEPAEVCEVLRQRFRAPFPILSDPDKQAYRAYGLGRGTAWQLWGPHTWWPGLRALLRGGIGKPVGDLRQLPGTFVIDRRGGIHLAHYAANQTDRPPAGAILAALESAQRGDYTQPQAEPGSGGADIQPGSEDSQ